VLAQDEGFCGDKSYRTMQLQGLQQVDHKNEGEEEASCGGDGKNVEEQGIEDNADD